MLRDRLRKFLAWPLVAGYLLTAAAFLVVALNNVFFYDTLVSDHFRMTILRQAPCGAVDRYVGFVLEDTDKPFRSSWEKMKILDVLVQAEEQGVRLCYNPKLVLPYLDKTVALQFAMGEDEPLGRLAEQLVLKRRDPGLIKAAFDRYQDNPSVISDLCYRLQPEDPFAPGFLAARQRYCPTPSPAPAAPTLTPEERRRKDAFEHILNDSRRRVL